MPRKKSRASVLKRIEKLKQAIVANEERHKHLANQLKALYGELEQLDAQTLMAAYKRSGKSMEEALIFFRRK